MRPIPQIWLLQFGIKILCVASLGALQATAAESANASAKTASKVDFNRDIRPIFSDVCYARHGPDEKERKGKLRLDQREGAFSPAKSGAVPVIPGDLGKSELIRRITTIDEDDHM